MNAAHRDPVLDGLDRLAGLADREVVGDRMPDIRRRVRVARQRRMATVGLAAVAALALGVGVGVWRLLPSEDQRPLPAPQPSLDQSVTIEAEAFSSTILNVGFTVSGRSSAYVDNVGGGSVPAGPFTLELTVDGDPVPETPDPGDLGCEPGGEVSSYSTRFPRKNPRSSYSVRVSGPGDHTVTVRATYCADGELRESSATQVVPTVVSPAIVMDRTSLDLDGDGDKERLELLAPGVGEDGDQELRVAWADGETSSTLLPDAWERSFATPYDLDGDGRVEIVLTGGGGEFVGWDVFLVAADRSLVPVTPVKQDGSPADLSSSISEGQPLDETWQVSWTPGIFVSWRAREASPRRPATVDVRRWVLSGSRLVEKQPSEPGCWQTDFSVTVGGCG